MRFHRSWQICLSSVLALLSVQFQTVAQTAITESEANHPAGIAPISPPYLFIPDLPPLRPTLPEPVATIRLVLKRGERRVYVYRGDEQLDSYPVAVGKPGWETPIGSFQVIQMLENPGWTHPFTGEVVPPGTDNPLGERWIGFWTDGTNYIGFHGTPTRDSVGQAASHGCVRMYNEDIRELYEIVAMGIPVIVEP